MQPPVIPPHSFQRLMSLAQRGALDAGDLAEQRGSLGHQWAQSGHADLGRPRTVIDQVSPWHSTTSLTSPL